MAMKLNWKTREPYEEDMMLINAAIREAASYALALAEQNGTCPVLQADLPEVCEPRECRIGFERAGGTSKVLIDKGVAYQGENAVFRTFLADGMFSYQSADELEGFLSELDSVVGAQGAEGSPENGVSDADIAPITAFDTDVFRAKMAESVIGQDHVIETLSGLLTSSVRKTKPARPLALVFAGETGVGKTLTARCMAEALTEATGAEFGLLRIDMNQLGERYQESRFYGAPPGYIGYNDPPLFEPVKRNPRQVILFDEMEKADPGVMLTLMNAMSDGRIESARIQNDGGNAYDLTRCIMVFTTNCHFDIEEGLSQAEVTDECRRQMRGMFNDLRFPPEIIGRLSEVLLFSAIDEAARRAIAELSIKRLGREYSLEVASVDSDLLDSFCWLCSCEGGVRNIEYMAERVFGRLFADYVVLSEITEVNVAGGVYWPNIIPVQE